MLQIFYHKSNHLFSFPTWHASLTLFKVGPSPYQISKQFPFSIFPVNDNFIFPPVVQNKKETLDFQQTWSWFFTLFIYFLYGLYFLEQFQTHSIIGQNVQECPCLQAFKASPGIIIAPHQSDACVITGEPTLTCHCYLKPVVYIKFRCWCCTLNEFGEMCIAMYPPPQHHSEQFFCPKVLYALPIHPSLSLNPCQSLILFYFFTVQWFCLFQNVIQLKSLSIQPVQIDCLHFVIYILGFSKCFHVLEAHPFLALAVHCLQVPQFIYSFAYLRISQLLPSFCNYK